MRLQDLKFMLYHVRIKSNIIFLTYKDTHDTYYRSLIFNIFIKYKNIIFTLTIQHSLIIVKICIIILTISVLKIIRTIYSQE